jgi:large repetitive protein
VTFTATVTGLGATGTPTGTVTFSDDGTTIASAVELQPDGLASATTSSLPAGSQDIAASYSGDANFGPSEASFTQVVDQAASFTTVSSSVNPSVVGQSVTLTAAVSSLSQPGPVEPTGTVTFADDGASINTTPLAFNGLESFTTSSLPAGNQLITATYSGDANFAGSTANPLPITVNQAASTTTTLSSSVNPSVVGQEVTVTATVAVNAPGTGTPTGTVTFSDHGTPIASAVGLQPDGTATVTSSSLAAGSQFITASYSGDTDFDGGSSNALTQVVNPPAVPCAPGSYNATGFTPCNLAPAGSFDAGSGSTSPTACPSGTYNATPGSSACAIAPAGSFDAGSGNIEPSACPAGTYSSGGQLRCWVRQHRGDLVPRWNH